MPQILKGSTDVTRYVMLRDSAAGTPETGYTITNLDLQYTRNREEPAAKVDATALSDQDDAHADNQAIEVDGTSSPGLYRVDWPDAAFATGADKVILVVSGTGLDPAVEEIDLVNFSTQDGVRLGLTALPNAAADAAGGLPISDAGGLDLDAQVVTKINSILDDTDLIDDGTSGLAKIATDVAAILVDTTEMGAGTGARSVTITVNDGSVVLENARVRFTSGAESYSQLTNVSGVATFSLDDATWNVTITKPFYSFTPTTLVVNGTETQTYSMTALAVASESAEGDCYDPLKFDICYDKKQFTYWDAVEHLLNWSGSATDPVARQDARRACQEALRDIANAHKWSYYYASGRISTVAQYTTGTITYDHTGGAYERLVTLSGGTFPDWATHGTISISSVSYNVARRLGNSTLQLEENSNPGADVASGTSYTLFREQYPLPPLFLNLLSPLVEVAQNRVLMYYNPKVWLNDRRVSKVPSQPFGFTVMGSRRLAGQNAVWFSPAPEIVRSYDVIYQRTPSPLSTELYNTGTVTSVNGTSTLEGTGVTFTNAHRGAVIRLSSSTTVAPTGWYGTNPPAQERVIMSISDSDTLIVDQPFDQSLSGVKFTISDPVDVDQQTMLNLYLRAAEKRMGSFRHRKDQKDIEAQLAMELPQAMAADSRWASTRQAGLMRALGWTEAILHTATLGDDVG